MVAKKRAPQRHVLSALRDRGEIKAVKIDRPCGAATYRRISFSVKGIRYEYANTK